MPAVFEAALVHSETHEHKISSHHHSSQNVVVMDQSTSAIIYVSVSKEII